MPKAGFILQDHHIRDESYDLSQYELIVCNSGIDPDKIRAKVPRETLLIAHLNLCWLLNYGSPFYQKLEIAFNPSDFFTELIHGFRHFRPSLDVGARYAHFIANEMSKWDGIHWDHGNPSIPGWRMPTVMKEEPAYWDIRFKAWRSYLFQLVNMETHPNFFQIGNTNSWDMDLDGVCLEEGGGFDQLGRAKIVRALGIYASQREIQKEKTNRLLNVAWFWGSRLDLRGLALYGERLPASNLPTRQEGAGGSPSLSGRREAPKGENPRVPYIFGPQKSDN
jgi:hypothetical protein